MSLEIKVGPPQISIHQGHVVLITEPDGQIVWPSEKGLYFNDTRLISSWTIWANGEAFDLLNSGSITYYAARYFLTNRAFSSESGPVEARTLSVVVGRTIEEGMHEDLDLTNHGHTAVRFNLEVTQRSDFADIFEVKAGKIVRRGRISTDWNEDSQRLTNMYRNGDFVRDVSITAINADSRAIYANGRLTFAIELEPGASWHACLIYELSDGTHRLHGPMECIGEDAGSPVHETLDQWRRSVTKLETPNEQFRRLYEQAIDDMAALRLPIAVTDHMAFIPAAGLPWFVALFGRDSLIVSLQNALVYWEFARGALEVLGTWQATELDPWRDAEPGKIPHELRRGELAYLKLIPHTPYYGTADATPLYPITLHTAWMCNGDRRMLEAQLPAAQRCLEWIDNWGDRDGDGFQEYQTQSPHGYENMAWKDAGDSVMHADGAPVKGPKALCELQGYVYDAWLRMAEIYDALERHDQARALRVKAERLFVAFNETFWNEDLGFYAYALDGDKRQVLSVASNVGHCLWSGIVPPDRAARVVRRMMMRDMWSGWGIRTLSAQHPSYNPYSYQNGSVWPHDNGLIAMGFKRYGFHNEVNRIAHDINDAASFFMLHQLPELYAGLQRDETNFPVQYLGANVPQAWAAGSVFSLIQAMIGFQPDAPNERLYLDPALPDWLPELTVRDLHIDAHTFDIRFYRHGEATEFEVIKGGSDAVRRRSMVDWAAQLRHGIETVAV